MRKYFLFALAAIVSLVIASCSEEVFSDSQSEELVDVTYTINTLSQTSTRATHDGDGNANKINRYICEVWHVNADNTYSLFVRKEKKETAKETTFDLHLVASHSYKVLFWADYAYIDNETQAISDFYYTTNTDGKGLQEVALKKTTDGSGNTDEMDAFYGKDEITNLKSSLSPTITLTRPFAQLNVITTDIKDIEDSMKPNKVKLKVNAPTKFNVLSGEASEPQAIDYTADVYYDDSHNKKPGTNDPDYSFCTLAMSYIFASKDEKDLTTVNLDAIKEPTTLTSPEFSNIPLQRNYRTNIIGSLLTNSVDYTVTIDADWKTEEYDVNVTTVTNIAAANEVLKEVNNVVVTMPDDASSKNVVFPVETKDKEITLSFEGTVTGGKITFENAEDDKSPKSVTISAPEGTILVFNNESHVVLNGTRYTLISGSFSPSTLVINEGVTVEQLTIEKGGLEIHGTVNEVTPINSDAYVVVRACEGLSEDVYNALKAYIDSRYIVIENNTNPKTYDIVLNAVAEVNGVSYATLDEAIEAAEANAVVKLLKNIEVTKKIILNKSVKLDLNGFVITDKVNQARVFEFAGEGIDFTVDGTKEGSGMTIPEGWDDRNGTQKAWGFIRTNYAGCNITLNGGTYTGKTQNGSFVTVRYPNTSNPDGWTNVVLNDVSMSTNMRPLDIHYANKVTVNGGNFVATGGEDNSGTPVSVAFTIEAAQNALFTNVTCNSPVANIEAVQSEVKFVNCDFTAVAGWSGSVDATNIGVSYGGHAIVESGSYKITDPNNLQQKTGASLFVYSSGGTIEVNDGTFVGIDDVLRIGFDRGTYGKYFEEGEVPSNIIINGGSFSGTIKNYYGTDADCKVEIAAGTFSVKPDDKYIKTGCTAKEVDGKYVIEELVVAQIGSRKFSSLKDAIEAANANDVIELFEGVYTTYGTTYAKNKTLTFVGAGADKTIWKYGKNATVSGEGGSDYSFEDSNVTFKNITLEDNFTVNSYYRGFVRPASMNFENCTIKNMMGYLGVGDVHFSGCVFDVASVCEYAVKCYSGKDFYFNDCTFKGNNKANIQLYIQDSSDAVHYVQVKDCKFYRGSDKSRTAVYYYDQGATEGGIWEIHLDGNNENLGEIAVNTGSGSWLWGSMKHNSATSKTTVYEGETLVWANGVKAN